MCRIFLEKKQRLGWVGFFFENKNHGPGWADEGTYLSVQAVYTSSFGDI
jgi:hypothetical protein